MGIDKPYYRIWRPMINGSKPNYVGAPENSKDRYHLSEAYNLIEKDLIEIFEYVQPNVDNFNTYSHRIFELFLRASSEFEANCKMILYHNNYTKKNKIFEESRKDYKSDDFYKINAACKLSDYRISIDFGSELIEIIPFDDWEDSKPFKLSKDNKPFQHKSLGWYEDYHKVKHDRVNNFKLANVHNLIKSVGAVQIMLISQFYSSALLQNRKLQPNVESDDGHFSFDSSIFWIKPPKWEDNEKYNFDWDMIKNDENKFKHYPF